MSWKGRVWIVEVADRRRLTCFFIRSHDISRSFIAIVSSKHNGRTHALILLSHGQKDQLICQSPGSGEER